MIVNIDYKSRVAIYQQIVNEIERLVTLEILKCGEQIPSIRELACSIGINPNTVKKAYDILEDMDIITTKSTKGTFISDNINKAKDAKIEGLVKEVKEKMIELEKLGLSKDKVWSKIK